MAVSLEVTFAAYLAILLGEKCSHLSTVFPLVVQL